MSLYILQSLIQKETENINTVLILLFFALWAIFLADNKKLQFFRDLLIGGILSKEEKLEPPFNLSFLIWFKTVQIMLYTVMLGGFLGVTLRLSGLMKDILLLLIANIYSYLIDLLVKKTRPGGSLVEKAVISTAFSFLFLLFILMIFLH